MEYLANLLRGSLLKNRQFPGDLFVLANAASGTDEKND